MVPAMPIEGATLEARGPAGWRKRGWRMRLGLWFGGSAVNERAETMLLFPMSAEEAWGWSIFARYPAEAAAMDCAAGDCGAARVERE